VNEHHVFQDSSKFCKVAEMVEKNVSQRTKFPLRLRTEKVSLKGENPKSKRKKNK